jgi:hypothetical protein
MSDLDQELRELLEAKARDGIVPPKPDPQVLKRARRRQFGTVVAALVGTAALLVASIVGLQALVRTNPDTTVPGDVPVLPDAPEGFRAVALPLASITYPQDWFLVATGEDPEEPGPILQLTNFEPGLTALRCVSGSDRIASDALLLRVSIGTEMAYEETVPASKWPVELATPPEPGPFLAACGNSVEKLFAKWTSPSGLVYTAHAILGSEVRAEDREAVLRTFGSLSVAAAPQTENFLGKVNLILDSAQTPVGPVALYAYLEPCEGSTHWIGIAGPSGSGLVGSVGCGQDEVPTSDASVTMNLDLWGGVVWGEVASTVARAELRTVEGETFPAELIPMPPSLGVEGTQVVWGFVEGPTSDRVTTLLYDEEGNVLNTYFPAGPRITIAEGTDPEGGPWLLYLDMTSEGAGLGFQFETGGGGSGCCLKPFGGDFRLDGWGSGGDEPANITAIGSDALDRVVFEAASGEEIAGQVFSMPDESLGVPKVALVLVPRGVPVEGNLVAYDADGNEIGREFVGEFGEPPGPTPEIDAVWILLRQGRDAISQWASKPNHSLADLTIDVANASMPEVPWNASGQGKPVPGQVSIRGIAPAGGSELTGWSGWTLALVSVIGEPDGSVTSTYCIALNIDDGGGGNYRYGTQDAAGYEECRGGWPEVQS